MTHDTIQKRLDSIRASSDDQESAHGKEDDLYVEFIQYVADSAPVGLAEKARLVLASRDIQFSRWCA